MRIPLFALLVMCGTLIAIVLVLFLPTRASRRKTSTPADRPSNGMIFRDDERYWRGGLFYNNPDDPALFVPKRFGIGRTMNFGHPQSRLILMLFLIGILVVVVLPLIVAGLAPAASGCHSLGCTP